MFSSANASMRRNISPLVSPSPVHRLLIVANVYFREGKEGVIEEAPSRSEDVSGRLVKIRCVRLLNAWSL